MQMRSFCHLMKTAFKVLNQAAAEINVEVALAKKCATWVNALLFRRDQGKEVNLGKEQMSGWQKVARVVPGRRQLVPTTTILCVCRTRVQKISLELYTRKHLDDTLLSKMSAPTTPRKKPELYFTKQRTCENIEMRCITCWDPSFEILEQIKVSRNRFAQVISSLKY